jgi:hypothetical protein
MDEIVTRFSKKFRKIETFFLPYPSAPSKKSLKDKAPFFDEGDCDYQFFGDAATGSSTGESMLGQNSMTRVMPSQSATVIVNESLDS